ncbi:hypothetical protein SAMN04488595_103177 [Ralstonia sp. 25mfcol4.1]|uniref:hypothetical protein n=1 Tax=Burkholderiaceae TaxID=119060 RepID=UPI0004032A03|nr:hypothetical protein [Ralstonia sp. 25mfcol4.1]SDO94691.1 hypothetical protein SAMN04488595_103177 [Ralstonia sp. 25mfcol4.1]
MNDGHLIKRIALAVADHVRPALPVSVALWDVDRIAEFLVRSPKVVRERIVTLPDFPKAIRIPSVQSGGGAPAKALPRWRASEVVAWAESYKDQPRGRPRKAD